MLRYIEPYCTSIRLDDGNYVAVLKPEYAIDGVRVLKADAKSAVAGRWVTINGAHVLIGKNGIVLGGAGGKFNGMNLSDGVRRMHRNRGIVNASLEQEKLMVEKAGLSVELREVERKIGEIEVYLPKRIAIFGKDHFKVTSYKHQLGNLKKEKGRLTASIKKNEAKLERLKKRYKEIDAVSKTRQERRLQRAKTGEERKLRNWAKEHGYDPSDELSTLSNFRYRETYNTPYRGGKLAGD